MYFFVTLCLFLFFVFSTQTTYGDSLERNVIYDEFERNPESNALANPKLHNQQKVLNWFKNLQHPNGLLESVENGNKVSLYDQALATLVFLATDNIENAEKVFNFFNDRIDNELLVKEGGFLQFRNRDGGPIPGHQRRWLGDNAWLLIALNNYKNITGHNTYDRLAIEIENWIRSLQEADGSLFSGTQQDGTLHKIAVSRSIIDAYNAIPGYDIFHSEILRFLETHRWGAQQFSIISWPGNKYHFAMDLHPWSYCIFEDFPVTTLARADKFLTTQVASVNGATITGYCFDIDKDTVWLEGTGQMVVALNRAGKKKDAAYYLAEMEKILLDSKTFDHSAGLPYVTNRATAYARDPLWEGSDTLPAISSSAWYIFGKLGFDPFAVGQKKNAPAEDRFWKAQN